MQLVGPHENGAGGYARYDEELAHRHPEVEEKFGVAPDKVGDVWR
jgi:hypothetical protein